MNEDNLIKYYNKFYEKNRLNTRHGQVEFITTMKYIKKYLKNNSKILDIGAGMGAYSIALKNQGYNVEAIDLVKHNLSEIKKHNIKCYLRNATNLHGIKDKTYDLVLLFGPMYHLINDTDKLKALNEAKRVLKDDGTLLVVYIMNEYCLITHGFKEKAILDSKKNNLIDKNYQIKPKETDLYAPVRIKDINRFNKLTNLKRKKILTQDGPANYLRPYINKLNDQEFQEFINYHLKTCEDKNLLAASYHILDILKKN